MQPLLQPLPVQIMRVLALPWLLTSVAGLTTYAPPPLRVLESPTRDEVDACAATMCEGFWTTSQLTPAQVAALHKTQSDDFRTRFSGKRRLRGSLIVLPDDDEGVAATWCHEDAINATGKQLLIKKPVTRRARARASRPGPAAGPRAPWLV